MSTKTGTLTSKAQALFLAKQQKEIERWLKLQKEQQVAEQKLLDAFEKEFKDLLPLLKADGIGYRAKLNDPRWPNVYGGYIEFYLDGSDMKDCKVLMDMSFDGNYRYEHVNPRGDDQPIAKSIFARWDKDEFILWLATGLNLI